MERWTNYGAGEEEEKMVVAEKKNWCNFCSEFTMDPMWRILRRNFGYNAWNASFFHCVGHYGLPTKNHPTYYTYFCSSWISETAWWDIHATVGLICFMNLIMNSQVWSGQNSAWSVEDFVKGLDSNRWQQKWSDRNCLSMAILYLKM